MIVHGDCLEAMAAMEPESVDAIVTDPPYNLVEPRSVVGLNRAMREGRTDEDKARRSGGFMGKSWDGTGIAFRRETWEAAYRVAKPSAYLLAFGGTRTVHRMTVALEDAGWIIRDMLVWAYASGFPKSKASLKPAWEPIVMARKPGPLRDLAIDACRIPHAGADDLITSQGKNPGRDGETVTSGVYGADRPQQLVNVAGRWPANVLLSPTEDGRAIFDGGVEGVVGGGTVASGVAVNRNRTGDETNGGFGGWAGAVPAGTPDMGYGDSGTYSRFFLVPKSDRTDREPVVGTGGPGKSGGRVNVHPT